MELKKVDYVFVVVVYRNVDDIIDFLLSLKEQVKGIYSVIIVNNYFDDITMHRFEEIAEQYECSFINCENRGYGAGNNTGIRFALEKYEFRFLAISNPDIVVKKFSEETLHDCGDGVIGGAIHNLRCKKQNPMIVKNRRFATRMTYEGLKRHAFFPLLIGKAIYKVERIAFLLFNKREIKRVYQIHGSFLMFPKAVLEKIGAPYDEKMFLFAEEGMLAYILDKNAIPTYYNPAIELLHKEDGSMKFRNDIDEECVKACIYFYEKYYFNAGEM